MTSKLKSRQKGLTQILHGASNRTNQRERKREEERSRYGKDNEPDEDIIFNLIVREIEKGKRSEVLDEDVERY